MVKTHLFILLLLSVIALSIMFRIFEGSGQEEAINTEGKIEETTYPTPRQEISRQLDEVSDAIANVSVPSKEELIPAEIVFFVNRILVPQRMAYPYIPLKEDRIRTFSGSFGPYAADPRGYVYAELCSYPYKLGTEVKFCEKLDLEFSNGRLYFARGYDSDEFIANQALRDFGAYFVVKSHEYGELVRSNVAIVNIV